MKKISLLFAIVLAVSILSAQTPQGIKYQAVVRDNAGNVITNHNVSFRISILQGSEAGAAIYVETYSPVPQTNQFGLVNLNIGKGVASTGVFASINWGADDYFLKIEIDTNGGSTFTHMGTSQLLSVPYALYAEKAANAKEYVAGTGISIASTTITNAAPDQTVSLTGGGATSISGTYPNFTITTPAGGVPKSIADADNNTKVTTENAANENYIRFFTNGGERLRITPTGKLETTANSIYLGNGAGKNNTATYNVIIGDSAAAKSTGMSSSVAIGYRALYANSSGDYNAAIGALTLTDNTSGSYNSAIGRGALSSNTTGKHNQALGYYSLANNTTGNSNIGIGYQALYKNTTSSNCIAIGEYSLYNQLGFTGTDTLNNIAIGNYALYSNLPSSNSDGRNNLALGHYTLRNNTTGFANTGLGSMSLRYNSTGDYNTAVGTYSMYSNSTGSFNAALGRRAGETNNGNYNVFVGYNAGDNNTTGSSNTFVGASASGAATLTNAMALGYSANVNASNKVVIGNASVTSIGGYAPWTDYSDIRMKENVVYRTDLGLDFIMKLKPASYNYISDQNKNRRDGLIAQDVEKSLKELGLQFSGLVIDEDTQKTESLAYGQFVVPLINAVQELYKQNQNFKKEIDDLKMKRK